MALLDILTYPNKELKKQSQKVEKVSSQIQDLAQDMIETMYHANGIGLAAPQIGEKLRLLVMDVPEEENSKPEPLVIINPEILSGEGKVEYEEGCLSCPELIVNVDRFAKVKVRFQDIEGRPCEIDLANLKGVCLQHELDHLNGTLLVDKVSRIEKDLYKNKRIKIAKNESDLKNVL